MNTFAAKNAGLAPGAIDNGDGTFSPTVAATVTAVLPAGAATSAKQDTGNASLASIDAKATSILNAIQASVDLETSLWTDNSGAFYVRRESVNEGTGTITITFTDSAGSVVVPGAGLRPLVSDANYKVESSAYSVNTAGVGYSIGDLLIHAYVLNVGVSPPTISSSFWLNITAGTVISAPNPAHLDNALAALLTSILANQTNGTQVTQVTGTVPLPTGAATEAKQDTGNTSLGSIDTKIVTKALNNQVVGTDTGIIVNSVIHGITTAGGGGYVDVKVNPSGALMVDATQSGTWTVQPGNTANTTAWLVTQATAGSVSGGTAGTASGLAGGQYLTAAPTLTNAQQAALQLDVNGRLKTVGTPVPSAATTALPTLGTARSITTSGVSASQALSTSGFSAVRLTAKDASLYFTIDDGTATATSSSHWLPAGGSIELRIDLVAMPAPVIAAIQDTAAGSLKITELV